MRRIGALSLMLPTSATSTDGCARLTLPASSPRERCPSSRLRRRILRNVRRSRRSALILQVLTRSKVAWAASRPLPVLIGAEREQRSPNLVVDWAALSFERADRRSDLGTRQFNDGRRIWHDGPRSAKIRCACYPRRYPKRFLPSTASRHVC